MNSVLRCKPCQPYGLLQAISTINRYTRVRARTHTHTHTHTHTQRFYLHDLHHAISCTHTQDSRLWKKCCCWHFSL